MPEAEKAEELHNSKKSPVNLKPVNDSKVTWEKN